VRFSLLIASSLIAAALTVSACNRDGGSSAVPGGAQQAASMNRLGGLGALKPIAMMNRDTKNECPSSKYLYCVDITPSSSGPYVCFSSSSSCGGSQQSPPYYAYGIIVSLKDKPTRKLSEYWDPFPGNPTDQYIVETKPLKASKRVKYVDQVYVCLEPSGGSCGAISYIGLIPQ
jgi:hypothetical protein